MEIQEFLSELELHFPMNCKSGDKEKLLKSYVTHLTDYLKGREDKYDLQKVLTYLLHNYKYSKLPALAEILEAMPHGLEDAAEGYKPCPDEGKVVIATLPNGYKYDFVISGCGTPIEQVKASLKRRFGECKVDIYPEGTCLIGNQVVTP